MELPTFKGDLTVRRGPASRRRFLLLAGAAPLIGCQWPLGADGEGASGRREVAPRTAPVRLGVPTGYLGDDQAAEAWRAAAARLAETGGPRVTVEAHDVRLPDAASLEPQGRVPALEHLFAADDAPDGFVWGGQLPSERVALVDRGLVQPVDRLLRASGAGARVAGHAPLDEYAPGALDALRDGESIYGLPVEATPLMLMVDTRVAAAAPAARPLLDAKPAAWTWAAFEEVCAQLLRLDERGALAPDSRWGFAPTAALPLEVLLWQHGALVEGGPRLRMAEPAARAALSLYGRLVRAALGPAVGLPSDKRPESQLSLQWGPNGIRLGDAAVAMSTTYGVPRGRFPTAGASGAAGPSSATVVVAPLPRLMGRVGSGDPTATQVRVNRFVAISARARQAVETARALHDLIGVVGTAGGEAAPIPARLPAAGAEPLPFLRHLLASEREAIAYALAHSSAFPPRAEAALDGYLMSRVRRPLLEEPARSGALEEALEALRRLGD